jgi:3-methyladenine DNA glycosylase AlkC
LEDLKLKARVEHVAEALASHLASDFVCAARVIQAVAERVDAAAGEEQMFTFWPLCTYVERCGQNHLEEALDTIRPLTCLATCEFALRPYLERFPERVFERLQVWAKDSDPRVRRLVSEGTRPRLPWGARLRALQRDPRRSLRLLDQLFEDADASVRRSVANHLNDISKDHPELAVATAARWTKQSASAQTSALVRHGLRTLVKQGHRGALELQGVVAPRVAVTRFASSPRRVMFGEPLSIEVELTCGADRELIIDYAVYHRKATGRLTPKVFKWSRQSVRKGQVLVLKKRHLIRSISTRRYYPGAHELELLVNGRSLGRARFELVGVPEAGR